MHTFTLLMLFAAAIIAGVDLVLTRSLLAVAVLVAVLAFLVPMLAG